MSKILWLCQKTVAITFLAADETASPFAEQFYPSQSTVLTVVSFPKNGEVFFKPLYIR
jgi:hypothetical protein